jgi:hypothetical protein
MRVAGRELESNDVGEAVAVDVDLLVETEPGRDDGMPLDGDGRLV